MQALVLDGVGEPLRLKEVADPKPGQGEVVIALQAAALNRRDLWIQKGQYAGLKFPIILGSDGCGTVAECGADVDPSWQGKTVIINPSFGWPEKSADKTAKPKNNFRILGLPEDGTFAQMVCVPAAQLAAKPAHLDAVHAAALPLAGLTVYRALFTRANLQSGENVLITGAGGGTGQFALQFALAAGATVWVTSGSEDKIARAVAMGVAGGVSYKAEKWSATLKEKVPAGFDVIIDSTGGPGFLDLIELAAPEGRIAFFGATNGDPAKLPMRRIFWKHLSILGTTMGSPADFAAMVAFVNEKKVTPLAELVFPLAQGNEALQAMETSDQFGKIALTIS